MFDFANMSATQLAELVAQATKVQEAKKAEEQKFNKVIAEIKKLGDYDKKAFTALLKAEQLIESDRKEKVKLLEITYPKTADGKQPRGFYIFAGDNPNSYTLAKKTNWANAKDLGKDYVLSKLTDEGKKHYNTESGKQEIEAWFN